MSEAKVALIKYDDLLESALSRIGNRLRGHYGVSRRTIGLLLLQGDSQIESEVKKQETADYVSIQRIVAEVKANYSQPLSYVIALRRQQATRHILDATVT